MPVEACYPILLRGKFYSACLEKVQAPIQRNDTEQEEIGDDSHLQLHACGFQYFLSLTGPVAI
jgi:hypothetical protein